MYTMSEFSRLTETSPHTIRYYEAVGLISPKRNASGRRVFDSDDLTWFRFVLKLRETQMPIETIRSYVELFQAESKERSTVPERLTLLEQHQQAIAEQLRVFEETNQLLLEKIETYRRLHAFIPEETSR